MSSQLCSMASLVEARRDGRLGERESASLARHLGACASCRELERDLDEVRGLLQRTEGPPLTALEHQRNRLALLRAAAAPPPSKPRHRLLRGAALPGAALPGAMAALAAVAALALTRPHPPSVAVAQHLPASTLHGVTPMPPGRRPYPSETTVRGSAEARFEQGVSYDGGDPAPGGHGASRVDRVALHEGTLDLAVRKLVPGERFLVATDDAEVEVRGTVFEVEAHAGRIARVTVSEGKVEVRYRRVISVIAAGGAWRAPEETAAIDASKDEAPGERRRAAFGYFGGHVGGPQSALVPASKPPPAGDSDASTAFGSAVDLLGRGDYAAARARLDAFRAEHPADGRADLAAFLAIVSLQHAGRRAEAQEAARRYLELYPNGDRRADAARVAGGR